jgi:tRNA 2-thiouridine synthesizing protein A
MTSSHSTDAVLDLGEKGCGQLVMEIMLTMRTLKPGQTLLVIAYDPAAAVDIAAWCRMTGNPLVSSLSESTQHQYCIQKG